VAAMGVPKGSQKSRYDLSAAEWRLIEPLLPRKREVRRVDDRRVMNGIFYVLRTRSAWRDVPARYGPPTTVYNRFNRWAKAGVWQRVFEVLAAKSPDSLHLIDMSMVHARLQAAVGREGTNVTSSPGLVKSAIESTP
jgi:transposase